jgi:futalosine hydrolase
MRYFCQITCLSMRILIVAATNLEILPFVTYWEQTYGAATDGVYKKAGVEIKICLSGIGMMLTTFALQADMYSFKPDFCLQVGIGGAFNRNIALGSLVWLQAESMGDLGAQDGDRFIDVFELQLMNAHQFPFQHKKLFNTTITQLPFTLNLPAVNGITVNKATGSNEVAFQLQQLYNADVESMEGAAFHYVCLQLKVPFIQVRSISNYVEARDKSKWDIKGAVKGLNEWLINTLTVLLNQ